MFCKIVYEFRYHDGHRETFPVIREFRYPYEAHIFADSYAAAAQQARKDEVAQVRVLSVAPVKTGKTWVVTMDGTAHYKEFGIHDLHNVIFVDAEDPHDAEQVAYRTWENTPGNPASKEFPSGGPSWTSRQNQLPKRRPRPCPNQTSTPSDISSTESRTSSTRTGRTSNAPQTESVSLPGNPSQKP